VLAGEIEEQLRHPGVAGAELAMVQHLHRGDGSSLASSFAGFSGVSCDTNVWSKKSRNFETNIERA
jgi:hypothetical protein